MITNEDVFVQGKHITDWACDFDVDLNEPRSNGGVETLVVFEKKAYTIVSNFDYTKIFEAKKKAIPLTKEQADGFIMDELQGEDVVW